MAAPSAAAITTDLTTDRSLDLGVHFTEAGIPEKNTRNTGETNYNNSTHISSKFENNQHRANPGGHWSLIQLTPNRA